MFYGKRLEKIEERLSKLEGRNAYETYNAWNSAISQVLQYNSAQNVIDEVKTAPEVWKVTWNIPLPLSNQYTKKTEVSFYSEAEAKDHASVLEFAHEFIGNDYSLCVEIKKMQ